MAKLKIIKGNIIQQYTDAIVNATDHHYSGGGAIDKTIHNYAGRYQMRQACNHLPTCKTGQAYITSGFKLPAKYVIHTVGPVWRGKKDKAKQLLSDCYKNCLKRAILNHCKSIAFCSISTGTFHFPLSIASKIAVNTIKEFNSPIMCYMVCFSNKDYLNYHKALTNYKQNK